MWNLKNLTFIFVMSFSSSCTLYKSSGREAIVENENNIVGSYATGIDQKASVYYNCVETRVSPDFLKEPLVVLETHFEKLNFSALFKEKKIGINTSQSVIVYRYDENQNIHDFCQLDPIQNVFFNPREIAIATELGVHLVLTKNSKRE